MVKWKTLMIIIIFMLMIRLGSGLMCKDTLLPTTQNCSFITPSLNCSTYFYEVYNESDHQRIQNDSLQVFNGSIYYFNWTINTTGSYIIKLCDDTTREVSFEQGGDTMIIGIIIILPLLFGFMLLIVSFMLDKDHAILKYLLAGLSFPFFYTSLTYGLIALLKFYNFPELQDAISFTTSWTSMLMFFLIFYFLIFMVWKIKDYIKLKSDEKKGY